MTVAITPRTIYDGKDLSSGYTWNVDLTNSYFYGCNLSGVDLSQVTSFKGCEFYWCNMTGTKFTNLDLRNLNFGAGPTLQWCNLTSADFTGCNLKNVNLTGNTLTGVIISGATTTGTIGLIGVGAINITGPPVAGYNTWFHADSLGLANNASVVQLTDSSGNSNHFVQATSGKRGTYVSSKPAVSFNGTSDWYNTSGTVLVGTMFAVFNHSDTGATFTDYRRIVNASPGWSWYGASGASIYTIENNIDGSEFFINGVNTTTAGTLSDYRVISVLLTTPSTNIVAVGDIVTVPDVQLYAGNFCELILYPTRLSTPNRQSVESYLKTKWGTP